MNNDLAAALGKTVGIMEAMPYLKLEEMDVLDQLYFVGAYMKFANDIEPLVKKYVGSDEKLNKLKEEKAKKNANDFANLLSFFQGKGKKEGKDDHSDSPSSDD